MSWLTDPSKDDFHAKRRNFIGASEVPSILGECDFNSPWGVWAVKTGRKTPFGGNFATRRGTDAEPEIKRLYEERTGSLLTEQVWMQYSGWPILAATLDGFCDNLVIEMKFPSAEKHRMAEQGLVPKLYRAQLQTQMLCAGVDVADYVSYNGTDIAIVRVNAEPEYQAKILAACKHFWEEYVLKDTPPPGGYVEVTGHKIKDLSEKYLLLLKEKDRIESHLNKVKADILSMVSQPKAKFYGLKLNRSFRKGSIDYTKIPELKDVDLEKHRKQDIEVITLLEDKTNEEGR